MSNQPDHGRQPPPNDDPADEDDADDGRGAQETKEADGSPAQADSDDSKDSDESDDSKDEDDSKTSQQTLSEWLLAIAEKVCKGLPYPRDFINVGIARATSGISAVLPAMPAATAGSLALGLPHAHPTHPPYVPLAPFGPAILGYCSDVLINGVPALQSGAFGFSPTCCGLSPFYEVVSGSSSVLVSGGRAVRELDWTLHCMPAPLSTHTGEPATGKLERVLRWGEVAVNTVRATADVANTVSGFLNAKENADRAARTHNEPLRRAASEALSLASAELTVDVAQALLSNALCALMGKDPAVPSGTPGFIMQGARNVVIGGMPVPHVGATARGLLRLASLRGARR